MTPPPVAKFRMIQLPIKNRERFGEWLNVMWDDEVTVNVLATCPEATVYGIAGKGYRIMTADATRGMKLRGCEAAAKSHFGWHMISGGNAFDVFGMKIFKEKLIEHPFEEVQRTKNDFTRVNFGWWYYDKEQTQPDIYEFGTSKAAARDCPVTVRFSLDDLKASARADDNLEVIRRW